MLSKRKPKPSNVECEARVSCTARHLIACNMYVCILNKVWEKFVWIHATFWVFVVF